MSKDFWDYWDMRQLVCGTMSLQNLIEKTQNNVNLQ